MRDKQAMPVVEAHPGSKSTALQSKRYDGFQGEHCNMTANQQQGRVNCLE